VVIAPVSTDTPFESDQKTAAKSATTRRSTPATRSRPRTNSTHHSRCPDPHPRPREVSRRADATSPPVPHAGGGQLLDMRSGHIACFPMTTDLNLHGQVRRSEQPIGWAPIKRCQTSAEPPVDCLLTLNKVAPRRPFLPVLRDGRVGGDM